MYHMCTNKIIIITDKSR